MCVSWLIRVIREDKPEFFLEFLISKIYSNEKVL